MSRKDSRNNRPVLEDYHLSKKNRPFLCLNKKSVSKNKKEV
jgi:hypothetical protein